MGEETDKRGREERGEETVMGGGGEELVMGGG